MAETIIDLKGNVIVADEFRGTTGGTTSNNVQVPAITVAGTTVGPGTLTSVLTELVTLLNTKENA